MKRPRRGSPVRRVGPDAIALDLPRWVVPLVADAADRVRRTAQRPGAPGFERLFGRIDESAAVDDPLSVLARQTMFDDVATAVAESLGQTVLSDAQAEAWLQVLSLSLAERAAELGVRDEEDRAALSPAEQRRLDVVYALQLTLIEALDTPS